MEPRGWLAEWFTVETFLAQLVYELDLLLLERLILLLEDGVVKLDESEPALLELDHVQIVESIHEHFHMAVFILAQRLRRCLRHL